MINKLKQGAGLAAATVMATSAFAGSAVAYTAPGPIASPAPPPLRAISCDNVIDCDHLYEWCYLASGWEFVGVVDEENGGWSSGTCTRPKR